MKTHLTQDKNRLINEAMSLIWKSVFHFNHYNTYLNYEENDITELTNILHELVKLEERMYEVIPNGVDTWEAKYFWLYLSAVQRAADTLSDGIFYFESFIHTTYPLDKIKLIEAILSEIADLHTYVNKLTKKSMASVA